MLAYLDDHHIAYAIAMPSNERLKAFAEPALAAARVMSAASGMSERAYLEAQYQTQESWPHARRVIIKGEVTRYPDRQPRDNARYVVTDLTGGAQDVYEGFYSLRGDSENRIKELKLDLRMDKTSCASFHANQFRVLLTAAAFVLYQEIRLAGDGTEFASAQVSTIRERLIKLAGWVKHSRRRIVIHLPDSAPWRSEWITIAGRLAAPPT